MGALGIKKAYDKLTGFLLKEHSVDRAMELAVGGDFYSMGYLEKQLLMQEGLKPEHYLIDVGCGSGRLSYQLRDYLKGKFIGTDIVEELLDYARKITNRPDWLFLKTSGLEIPAEDESADFISFFSVFTHLLHEQSYLYLQESKRVLKKGGKIVLSFLEFAIDRHWEIFDGNLKDFHDSKQQLNMFMSRDGIEVWARHLDLKIENIYDGDKPHIKIPNEITLESGYFMKGKGLLGQSVCVLAK